MKELISNNTLVATLLQSISDAVYVIDAITGDFVEANPSAWQRLGYTRTELLGLHISHIEAVLPSDFNWAQHVMILKQKGTLLKEGKHISKDGSTFHIEASISLLVLQDKEYVIAIVRDVSPRHEALKKLDAAQEALIKSSRAAGMSEVITGILHNVGNTLNSVSVSSSVIQEKLLNSEIHTITKVLEQLPNADDYSTFLKTDPKAIVVFNYLLTAFSAIKKEFSCISHEADELVQYIDHIKEVISAQQSYAKTSGLLVMTDVHELIELAFKLNESNIRNAHILCSISPHQGIEILTNRQLVLQIVTNLVKNAVEAFEGAEQNNPKIDIRLRKSGQMVEISVQDNGIGIPSEAQAQLFQHGYTTKELGHGFGLSMSRQAAESLGGKLLCQSQGIGRGTCFKLRLPFAVQETEGKVA